jgi:hypothetical protein
MQGAAEQAVNPEPQIAMPVNNSALFCNVARAEAGRGGRRDIRSLLGVSRLAPARQARPAATRASAVGAQIYAE